MAQSKRIHLLDNLRGLAVVCMVVYHALYTMTSLFNIAWSEKMLFFLMPAVPYFASLFIFLCGLSCRLTRSNIKRGLWLLAIATGISVATILFLPEQAIYFGILQLLSFSILLFVLLRPLLDKISSVLGIAICVLLFAVTYSIAEGFIGIGSLFRLQIPALLYELEFLFPIGIPSSKFFSADYFPLFPWFFMFLAGSFFGVYAIRGSLPKLFYRNYIPLLSVVGRHALLVYVLHQPVIYGLMWLWEKLVG